MTTNRLWGGDVHAPPVPKEFVMSSHEGELYFFLKELEEIERRGRFVPIPYDLQDYYDNYR